MKHYYIFIDDYSGQQLGAGCFGRVLKAEADGIVQESVVQTVAVKMVRSFADLSALASLVSELKILIHLGSQLNIVNLLGACTDIAQGIFKTRQSSFILIFYKSIV